MSEWMDDSSKLFKLQNFIIGLLFALLLSYITYLYFEYRIEHELWNTTFISPTHFWEQVPDWEWKSVITDHGVKHE